MPQTTVSRIRKSKPKLNICEHKFIILRNLTSMHIDHLIILSSSDVMASFAKSYAGLQCHQYHDQYSQIFYVV